MGFACEYTKNLVNGGQISDEKRGSTNHAAFVIT